MTKSLKDEIRTGDYQTYSETVNSVLISADGSKLVFLGKRYHYIFDAPENFAAFLDSPLDARAKVYIGQFDASETGTVTGYIELSLDNLSIAEIQQSKRLGFSPVSK